MKNMKNWVAILVIVIALGFCGWYALRGEPVAPVAPAAPTAQPTAEPTETPAEPVTDEPAQTLEDAQEEVAEVFEIVGEIVEVTDEYIVVKDALQGDVQVWLSDDTTYSGLAQGDLAVGQYAIVMYDGKMTRSLPPQITALGVGVHEIKGVVAEVQADGRVLLDRTDVQDQVIASLPEGVTLSAGDAVTLYTNGVMALSLPGQVNAIGVVLGE